MGYDPERPHRRSLRLRGHDYSSPGTYFVTLSVQGRARLLGAISGGAMQPSPAGALVEQRWKDLARRFDQLSLGSYAIMPDHLHGISFLDGGLGLGEAVRWFKTISTHDYIEGVRSANWPPFDRRLWQRNYYERIVRDEAALVRISAYIEANPARWNY